MKNTIFHCTNINLVEIRENILDEIYKMSPDVIAKTESCFVLLTRPILSDKCQITWTIIGKFLSTLLEVIEEILQTFSEVQTL